MEARLISIEDGLISMEAGLISIETTGEHYVYYKLNYCNFYLKYLITFKTQITAFVIILLKAKQKYKQ